MAHHAIAKGHDAAGIGGHHAAQSGRAACGQVNAWLQLHHGRSLLQSLQSASRAHHGHTAEALRQAPLRRAATLVEGRVHHARLLRVRGLAGDDHAAEGTAKH